MSLNNKELDRWNALIYDLQGTCHGLESFLEDNNADDLIDHLPFLDYLDNHLFKCSCCSWWYEISEMAENEDWECEDCAS